LWEVASGKPVGSVPFNDTVRDVTYSPRGASLAVVSADRSLRILDPSSTAQRGNFFAHGDAATGVAYAPNGQTLYTACADRRLRVWSAAAPAVRPRLLVQAHGRETGAALLSLDGRLLITAGADATVQVRRVQVRHAALEVPSPLSSICVFSD